MSKERERILQFNSNTNSIDVKRIFADYKRYIESIKDKISDGVYNFATADWHYNPDDHRCPHDSWVESFIISEKSNSDKLANRNVSIEISLLGAYHDGRLKLYYKGVTYYSLMRTKPNLNLEKYQENFFGTHGDWKIDEIYLSPDEHVVHNITLTNSTNWIIHCRNIDWEWIPNEQRK